MDWLEPDRIHEYMDTVAMDRIRILTLTVFLEVYTPGSTNIAVAGKWGTRMEEYMDPIENGDIPSSYVRLPEGTSLSYFFFF